MLGDSIEGVYWNAHTVRSVNHEDETVEDLVEIVVYDPTHLFFRLKTRFDIGHSCSVQGIATLEHGAFVYRSWQLPLDNARPCTLRVEATADELRISDRLEPTAPRPVVTFAVFEATCPTSPSAERTDGPIQDPVALRSSTEFAEAVAESTRRKCLDRSIGGITMHPLRKLRESGHTTPAQVSALPTTSYSTAQSWYGRSRGVKSSRRFSLSRALRVVRYLYRRVQAW